MPPLDPVRLLNFLQVQNEHEPGLDIFPPGRKQVNAILPNLIPLKRYNHKKQSNACKQIINDWL
jgi:hypothetical protein